MWVEPDAPAGIVLALVAARVLPIALFSPLCGGRRTPIFVRAGLGLLLALPVAMSLPTAPLGAPLWMLLLKEGLIGSVLALAIGLFFQAVAGAGAMIDAMAGRGSPGVLATVDEAHDSPMSTLAFLFALAAFFTLGGGRMVITTLAGSFAASPPMSLPADSAGAFAGESVLSLGAGFFSTVLLLSAPVVAVMLLCELLLAVAARVLAPMNGFFTGLTLKPLLATLLGGLLFLAVIESHLPSLGRTLGGAVKQLPPPTP